MSVPPPLIDTTDWAGRRVTLSSSEWAHILRRHPELPGRIGDETAVIAAIARVAEAPHLVFGDPKRSYVVYAYRRFAARVMLRIIIWYIGAGAGEIRTAYLTNKPRPWEVPLWP